MTALACALPPLSCARTAAPQHIANTRTTATPRLIRTTQPSRDKLIPEYPPYLIDRSIGRFDCTMGNNSASQSQTRASRRATPSAASLPPPAPPSPPPPGSFPPPPRASAVASTHCALR